MLSPVFYSVQAFLCNPATMTRDKAFILPYGVQAHLWDPGGRDPGQSFYFAATVCRRSFGLLEAVTWDKAFLFAATVCRRICGILEAVTRDKAFLFVATMCRRICGIMEAVTRDKAFYSPTLCRRICGIPEAVTRDKAFLFAATVCRHICGILEAVTRNKAFFICRYGVQAHLWDPGGRDPEQSSFI